jgi:hypothetical protein
MRHQGSLAVLLMAGTVAFAGPAAAVGGKCNISKTVSSLLATSGNGVVEKINTDINTLSSKLSSLASTNTFYPPEGEARKALMTRFEDAIATQKIAFAAFLKDVVSARDQDCENCRYVEDWKVLNTAGYPNVTPAQIFPIGAPKLASVSAFVVARKGCALGDDKESCEATLDFQIRQALQPLPDTYGDKGGQGFPGGSEFAARMQKTAANTQACK